MIATTLEQSRKLLELGINPDTADFVYQNMESIFDGNDTLKYANYHLRCVEMMPQVEFFEEGNVEFVKRLYKHFACNENTTEYAYVDKKNGLRTTLFGPSFRECDIPAWSLSALLELMPDQSQLIKVYDDNDNLEYFFSISGVMDTGNHDDPIDAAVEMIIWLCENDYLRMG